MEKYELQHQIQMLECFALTALLCIAFEPFKPLSPVTFFENTKLNFYIFFKLKCVINMKDIFLKTNNNILNRILMMLTICLMMNVMKNQDI